MKLISWNVNGIRAVLKKDFIGFMKKNQPDILCLQETRGYPENIDELFPQYVKFWNHAEKKGYSGTAVFVREKFSPLHVSYDIGGAGKKAEKAYNNEGRVLTLEYKDFYLVCVYTPNSGEKLRRLEYRMKWDKIFIQFLKKLDKKKPVVFCGDLNAAHTEIDLARPKENKHNAGFTQEERDGFSRILKSGFLDTFRCFHPEPGNYTWWSYRLRARERGLGWRIDYFGISERMRPRLKKAFIMADVFGSDHCPVAIEI